MVAPAKAEPALTKLTKLGAVRLDPRAVSRHGAGHPMKSNPWLPRTAAISVIRLNAKSI